MARKIPIVIDNFYHIYNRGTDKRIIFYDNEDRRRFMVLLYLCNGTKSINWRDCKGKAFADIYKLDVGQSVVNIGAYCLMKNHFHLLLHEKKDGGISSFMQQLCTAYSMYFNKKYKRKGTLFEGPFQYKNANSDNYLQYLFIYIHLNPVGIIDKKWKENGLKDLNKTKEYLNKYWSSSYVDYIGKNRAEKTIIKMEIFEDYFDEIENFEKDHDDWLLFMGDIENSLK
jgi:putative transposase